MSPDPGWALQSSTHEPRDGITSRPMSAKVIALAGCMALIRLGWSLSSPARSYQRTVAW
jgi:hypothetical protein